MENPGNKFCEMEAKNSVTLVVFSTADTFAAVARIEVVGRKSRSSDEATNVQWSVDILMFLGNHVSPLDACLWLPSFPL